MKRISESTLNPRTTLYRVVGPFSVRTASTGSPQNWAAAVAVALIITLMLLIVFIGVRGSFRRQLSDTDQGRPSQDLPA